MSEIKITDGRQICTPTVSKPKGASGRWAHTNVSEVKDSQRDGYPCGDTVMMRCSDCGETWEEELPQ